MGMITACILILKVARALVKGRSGNKVRELVAF